MNSFFIASPEAELF